MFGCTLAEKSAMREINTHGWLPPAAYVDTSYAPEWVSETWQHPGPGQLGSKPRGFVPRRCHAGFEVLRTEDMIVVQGPFKTLAEASEAAAILRMERKAERVDSEAIKVMAARADMDNYDD
tara:strand:+ start:4326 stop:4688 length:363 start_codon:yes stop_codon:yes gene_type:complete